jgi:hypothetical protein
MTSDFSPRLHEAAGGGGIFHECIEGEAVIPLCKSITEMLKRCCT